MLIYEINMRQISCKSILFFIKFSFFLINLKKSLKKTSKKNLALSQLYILSFSFYFASF